MSPTLVSTRHWLRAAANLMGSTAEVLFDGPSSLTPKAFDRIRHLEQAWSRFRPDSELNRLHDRAGEWVRVSNDLFVALRWCQRLHDETEGRFDPTIRSTLEQWGYDTTFREIDPTAPPPAEVTPSPGLAGLQLDREAQAVFLPPGMRIDLGGIGKGLAADLLSAELLSMGANGAYVCLGGDIAVAGEVPDEGWDVPLHHPLTDEPFATHRLRGGGLVMSTTTMRRWLRADGTEAHHLIDPRTGAPAETDVIAVAVAAYSAARAEALAKAAIIAGSEEAVHLLEGFGVEAWILTGDRVVRVGSDV